MIRAARPADAVGLRRVVEAAYAPFAAKGIDLPPVADGLDQDIRDHHVWVAEEAGQILGGVVLAVDGAHAHLMNLAVHPDAAGRGLGRDLIGHAMAQARAMGCTEMALATHRDMTGTQAFYQRLGWVETGREGVKVLYRTPL